MATYISGLCLPTAMLSTGVPYNVTTLEQLTADIATLNAILDNACVTPTPPLLGFELTWNDIANSPFATHTDLNAFINGNGGAANYTSVEVVGNVQTFYGGTAVDLGDSFMNDNLNIVSIRDDAFQVVEQGDNGQYGCLILETISLPALVTQGGKCQSDNAALTSLNLQALTAQGSANQSNNILLTSIAANLLTTQNNGNQANNPLSTTITTPALISIGTGNYVGCTYGIMTINVDASLFGAADILLAQAGGATII